MVWRAQAKLKKFASKKSCKRKLNLSPFQTRKARYKSVCAYSCSSGDFLYHTTLHISRFAFVAALTVKYMTGRFIGEYDPDMGEWIGFTSHPHTYRAHIPSFWLLHQRAQRCVSVIPLSNNGGNELRERVGMHQWILIQNTTPWAICTSPLDDKPRCIQSNALYTIDFQRTLTANERVLTGWRWIF